MWLLWLAAFADGKHCPATAPKEPRERASGSRFSESEAGCLQCRTQRHNLDTEDHSVCRAWIDTC